MKYTSCISHAPKTNVVLIREDYLKICGDIPSATLLAIFEFWTNIRIGENEFKKQENEVRIKENKPLLEYEEWIYKTYDNLINDSLKFLKRHEIVSGLKKLKELGFIETRSNPKYKWDRTIQYKLNTTNIQKSINHIFLFDNTPVNDGCVTCNQAIPKTTTETTSYSSSPPRINTSIEDINTPPAGVCDSFSVKPIKQKSEEQLRLEQEAKEFIDYFNQIHKSKYTYKTWQDKAVGRLKNFTLDQLEECCDKLCHGAYTNKDTGHTYNDIGQILDSDKKVEKWLHREPEGWLKHKQKFSYSSGFYSQKWLNEQEEKAKIKHEKELREEYEEWRKK